jgi:hypothetical protein
MMLQPKLLLRLTAFVSVILGLGPGLAAAEATADFLFFGNIPEQAVGCSFTAGDTGLVCPNGQQFVSDNLTVTAIGYAAVPGTSTPTALTLKPIGPFDGVIPGNFPPEGGLGENAFGPPSACTDVFSPTQCKIAGGASVAVLSTNGTLLTDVRTTSGRSDDTFQIYTGSSLSTLVPLDGISTTCPILSCETELPGVLAVAVQVITGDIIFAGVSFSATVPEPGSLLLLASGLLGFGCHQALQRRRADRRGS